MIATLAIFSAFAVKAQDTVFVFNKGILAGQYIIKADQTAGGITYKKKEYKKMGPLTIEIKGIHLGGAVYKRTLELTGDKETTLFIADETPHIKGQFEITNKAIKQRMAKGRPVKLYLLLNPANERMKIVSKRLFMGTLSAK